MLFPNLTKTENLHQDGYYNVKTEFFETSYNAKLNSLEFKHKKRMWKGGNIKYLKNQLKTLENVSKIKSLKSISSKNTSRGQGIFTTELREIYNQDGLAVVEERALVYLDENFKDQGRVLKRELIPDYTLTLLPTEEMLFRYVDYSCFSKLQSITTVTNLDSRPLLSTPTRYTIQKSTQIKKVINRY
jgi:hydroxyacyl-ACP dehydratase HTD2-like protein with hotdog domain